MNAKEFLNTVILCLKKEGIIETFAEIDGTNFSAADLIAKDKKAGGGVFRISVVKHKE